MLIFILIIAIIVITIIIIVIRCYFSNLVIDLGLWKNATCICRCNSQPNIIQLNYSSFFLTIYQIYTKRH